MRRRLLLYLLASLVILWSIPEKLLQNLSNVNDIARVSNLKTNNSFGVTNFVELLNCKIDPSDIDREFCEIDSDIINEFHSESEMAIKLEGWKLYLQDNMNAALEKWKNDYQQFRFMVQLGEWALQDQKSELALSYFELAERVYSQVVPEKTRIHEARCRIYLDDGLIEPAVKECTLAVQHNSNGINLTLLARSYFGRGEYTKTVHLATQALKVDQLVSAAYYWRGMAYFRLGELKLAERDLISNIESNDPVYTAFLTLSRLYVEINMPEQACQMLYKVVNMVEEDDRDAIRQSQKYLSDKGYPCPDIEKSLQWIE